MDIPAELESRNDLASRTLRVAIISIAVAYSLFHLWLGGVGLMSADAARHLNLMGTIVLIILLRPLHAGTPRHWSFAIDLVLVGLAVAVHVYLEIESDALLGRIGIPNIADKVIGGIAILLVFEIVRRAIGTALVITVGVFVLYAVYGNLIPGYWGHRGYGPNELISRMFMSTEGIYGSPLGVVVEFVVLFVLFGAFLQKTGAGQFFIDLARSLTGRMCGGAAKTAVLASAFMGSIVGSSSANVVTTGSITIPLMKKEGMPAHAAAGTEAASSVGGLLLPPIMGGAAFLLVSLTGIPYAEVAKAAALPALLYFVGVYANVHFYASKIGLKPNPLPGDYWVNLGRVLLRGLPFLVPLSLMVGMLIGGYSATYAGFFSILAMIATSFLRKETRLTPAGFIEALEMGARFALPVAAACACVGMVISVVDLTGIGVKFSSFMLDGTGGSLFLAICLVGLVSLVLGIELPVSAAYLIVAILCAPALVDLGLPVLTAHLIVLWFAVDSAVTPPVCVTSYVAAGVGKAPPFRTALFGWKMAKGLYIIPFLMAYTSITLDGTFLDIVMAVLTGATGLIAMAAAWEGYLVIRATLLERLILVVSVVSSIDPQGPTDFLGFAAFGFVLVSQFVRRSRLQEAQPVQSQSQSSGN
ncbi:TRAP transporter permease [Pelagibius sp.]|uniref:TRAP transporter permease n=1 Tax=Pelagibius sp. TaxID=1931238 RepID=UPI003BAE4629